jgi:ribonuclease HI
MRTFKLYTDGACSGNPGKGGWAAVAIDETGNKIMQTGGGCRLTTNNRMEIAAVALGLFRLYKQIRSDGGEASVTVHSDSQLVINTMNEGWSRKTNLDCWKQLDKSVALFSSVKFVKVKGHASDPLNILVDSLAVAESEKATDADDGYERSHRVTDRETVVVSEPEITEVRLLGVNTKTGRSIAVTLSNGTVITIHPKDGGFIQGGGTTPEMRITADIAWKYFRWLNGCENLV